MTSSPAKPSEKISLLAQGYFSLLARRLPVCCLSDEFHFMPRAEEARGLLHQTDRLDRETLEEVFLQVRAMKEELESLGQAGNECPASLLRQSMETFLLHWDTLRLWEKDPGLYLKVATIGLDLALEGRWVGESKRPLLCAARLEAIPRLLSLGEKQLAGFSLPAREASLEMADSCRVFLRGAAQEITGIPTSALKKIKEKTNKALDALTRYREFLHRSSPSPVFYAGTDLYQEILDKGYGWEGDLKGAGEILEEEKERTEAELRTLAEKIDPGESWQAVYNRMCPPETAVSNPVSLYEQEVKNLEAFFYEKDILPMPPRGSVRVEPTPGYLEPVRATASYSAPPFAEAAGEGGRFFVEGVSPEEPVPQKARLLRALHRDYRYLTAHETCPGHHVLDWTRLHLSDPVKRQVESALFYEGWACYAERLVDDCGYEPEPGQMFIRVRRELWRALRGRLDLELQTGAGSIEAAAEKLVSIGYSPAQARKQARRITLTPGYQLCYTLGKQSFLDLRSRFVPPLSLKEFHEAVLSSGQVPFRILEKMLR